MTHDRTLHSAPTAARATWRKTAVILAAWVTATVALGVPGGRDSSATAEVRAASAPKIVHSGPECLVGQPATPATSTRKRAKD
jgi:hypothetical protein